MHSLTVYLTALHVHVHVYTLFDREILTGRFLSHITSWSLSTVPRYIVSCMIYLQVFSLSSERYRAKVQKVKQEKVSRHRQRVSTLSDSVLPMYACTYMVYLRVCVCVCYFACMYA